MTSTDVGFSTLPNQIHRQATENGFEFNLMVIGESGLGKSTFINSLFSSEIYEDTDYSKPTERIPPTTKITTSTVLLHENGVDLRLTLIDTPGFGNAVDNTKCWEPIEQYLDKQFEIYMDEESRVHRTDFKDPRVHCCLYFLSPHMHEMKPLDAEVMSRLENKVNIIPVIAKADSLTHEECEQLKQEVMNGIVLNKIRLFKFPEEDWDEEDEEDNREIIDAKASLPFAVCASPNVTDKGVYGREYPWGTLEIENESHCDFVHLRNLVIRTYMQNLIDVTNDSHYEHFRRQNLSGLALKRANSVSKSDSRPSSAIGEPSNPMAAFEEELRQHEKKVKKMAQEMTKLFEGKVTEKEAKFKRQEEADAAARSKLEDEISKLRKQLESSQAKFLDAKRAHREEQELQEARKGSQDKKKKSFFHT